jgi:trehalose/maltose hydrolase-like predicted phosphorylase
VPFHADGVISQFDGYENLAEFDWIGYRRRYGNIERLDLILEAEGDSTNSYKLSKQADVLMLFYLLGNDGLSEQLSRLGYAVSDQTLRATLDYYSSRTSHGSTLSRVVAASVWAGYDESRSWQMFREALVADLDDTQGGTTREGIHLGAMAGTTDLVMRSFAGLRLRGEELIFDPRLPPHVSRLTFQVHYREQLIEVTLHHQKLRVDLRPSRAAAVRVRVGDTSVLLAGDEGMTFPLHPGAPSASVVQ